MVTQQQNLTSRATWELERMVKALTSMSVLNTPEENKRLEEAKRELSTRRQQTKRR